MDSGRVEELVEGHRALEAGEWDAARAAFEAALDTEETPEAHDGLGLARARSTASRAARAMVG